MSFSWDLKDLFANTEDFYEQIENIKILLEQIKQYENTELDCASLEKLLNLKWKIKELANNVLVYGSLSYYKNVKSEECMKLKSVAEEFSNQVDLSLHFIDEAIIKIGQDKIRDWIAKNNQLAIYKQYLDNLFRREKHHLSSLESEIQKDNIDKINKCLTEYNALLTSIKFGEIETEDGKQEITLTNMNKYLASRNRDTRKKTYFAISQSFKSKNDIFAKLLDNIIKRRKKNASIERYDSVLEKVLFDENIDSHIIETLIIAAHENIGLIQKYLEIKAKILGIDDAHLYDFGVPLDNGLKIKYTLDEAINIIKEALKPLGNKYLEALDYLLNGHIDALVNENKHQAITFSWHTYSFLNFRGSYVDLKNLIHEIGHIINYYFSKNSQPFIYEDSTIFVGETASLVNEILLNKYLYKVAKTKEEKLFYLSKEIENYFITVFKQTMYSEFENELYAENDSLTPEVLNSKYKKIIKKYYGNKVTYDKDNAIEWSRLGHLYRHSYYPYKYATGLLIASVVVNFLETEKYFREKYLNFLSLGSSMYSLELLKTLDVDFKNLEILNNGFLVLKEDIEKLEQELMET